MNEQWKVGDTAILKSGGPVMMVEAVYQRLGFVVCMWFDHDGVLWHEEFRFGELHKGVHQSSP